MNDSPIDECEQMECRYLHLIDYLVNDIKELECEVIRLRHELSKWLPDHEGLMLVLPLT